MSSTRGITGPSGGPGGEPIPYDPLDGRFVEARHAVYERLRRESPVFYSRQLDAWIVTTYDEAVAVLMDTTRFSNVNAIGIDPFETYPVRVRAILARGFPRFPGIIEMDPPVHTAYRNLVNAAFTPRRVARLEPRIFAIANELIDGLAGRTEADFVKVFGDPLPVRVISEILGVPLEDMARVQEMSDSFRRLEAGTIAKMPPERQEQTAREFVAFQRYVADLIEARRVAPADDLISVIAAARLEGGRLLTMDELVSTVIHLLFAGQETTTRVLASTVYLLLQDRTLWTALVADPNLAAAVFEEGLRLDPPVTYHQRLAKEPVVLGGVAIPAGANVHVVFASANRDAGAFQDAPAFDYRRGNANRHLGFGRGIHFCVGAPIGRLEGRVGLQVLARRMPSLRRAEAGPPQREDHVMLSGIASLAVRWDADEPLASA